jgi:hypothetical protein
MSRTLSINELLDELFADKQHPLSLPFRQWLDTSKRFKLFAETYRAKIRAKIRGLRDAESLRDLAFELETAYWLHEEPRLTVAYEQQFPGQARRPDFAVRFTTKFTFSVEVTRIRPAPDDDAERESNKVQYVIASKLPQMLPGMINLLVIGADNKLVLNSDLPAVMLQLKKRAEAKDAQLFSRSGARDAADFFRTYHRLSAILLRSTQEQESSQHSMLWINKEAKYALPANLQTILKG